MEQRKDLRSLASGAPNLSAASGWTLLHWLHPASLSCNLPPPVLGARLKTKGASQTPPALHSFQQALFPIGLHAFVHMCMYVRVSIPVYEWNVLWDLLLTFGSLFIFGEFL